MDTESLESKRIAYNNMCDDANNMKAYVAHVRNVSVSNGSHVVDVAKIAFNVDYLERHNLRRQHERRYI